MTLISVTATLENLLVTVKPPTFLDVGVSQAYLPWEKRLDVLLNTPQATANQIEALVWDDVEHELIEDLKGLPYIKIVNSLTGKYLASTLTLPHRIGTAYLSRHKDAMLGETRFREALKQAVRKDGIYPAVFRLDPMSIVLGCFLSHIQGNMRIPRVLSGQFVAENAVAMPNGGASHDPVSAAGDSIVTKGYFVKESKEKGKVKVADITSASAVGLGNVPYVRESYQAERYLGKFAIDTRLVEKSPLADEGKKLIEVLAKYLLVKFLEEPIMLRSECYLGVKSVEVGNGQELGSLDDLRRGVKGAIAACKAKGLFAGEETEGVTTVEIPIELSEVAAEEDGEGE